MRSLGLSGVLVLLIGLTGCGGPKGFQLKGKLTDGGKSVLPDKKGGCTIIFIPVPATGKTFPAPLDSETNTFAVTGPDGKGIPTGKYKVALNMMLMTDSPQAMKAMEKFNEKYAEGKTPIEVTVSGPDLEIDLAKFK